MYIEHRGENPEEISERNVDSLKGRWKRLNENANKWIAAYREAYSRKRSGMSQTDIEGEAHIIFGKDAGGANKFQDLFVFNEVMSKNEKWTLRLDTVSTHNENTEGGENEECNEESGGSSKRAKTSDSGENSTPSNPENPGSGCSTIPRPIGRDIAKRKGKGKASQYAGNTEIAAEIRAMRLTRESEAEKIIQLGRERLEFEKRKEEMKEQRKIMNINSSILRSLLAKDNLSQEEEEMKRHLMQVVAKQSM